MCVELFHDCVYCIFLLLDLFRTQNNAVFNLVKNIQQISFCSDVFFAQGSRSYKHLLRSVIGPENALLFPHQSDLSLRPIASWSPAFSRASGGFVSFHFEISLAPRDIFFCSDWLLWLLCFCFYDTFTTEKIFKYKQTF